MFSQIKDIKYIEQDFLSSPGACHRGGTSRVLGGKKFIFSKNGHVAYPDSIPIW